MSDMTFPTEAMGPQTTEYIAALERERDEARDKVDEMTRHINEHTVDSAMYDEARAECERLKDEMETLVGAEGDRANANAREIHRLRDLLRRARARMSPDQMLSRDINAALAEGGEEATQT